MCFTDRCGGDDLADGGCPTVPQAIGKDEVWSVAFSPDGKTVATGDFDTGTTYLWHVPTGARFASLTDPGSQGVTSVKFSPDGKLVAAADWNGSAYLWDIATGTRVAVATDPVNTVHSVFSLAFAPDGKTLATNDLNDYTYLWHVTGG